jgi:hypothetical protein
MKKTIIYTAVLLSALSTTMAQKEAKPVKLAKEPAERALNKGDNAINVYYGTNLMSSIYKRIASASGEDFKVKSLGPIGLVYEHMITDGIGIGAEFGYSTTSIDYRDRYDHYDPNTGQLITENYNYSLKFTSIRAMFRANFHFAKSPDFDCYGLLSAGYRSTNFSYNTNNPYNTTIFDFKTLIPFGLKPGIGFRYFFTGNFGLNLEIAAGTPLLCGGLAFKF